MNWKVNDMSIKTVSVGLGLILMAALPALSQPVEDCTGAALDGSATLPFNASFSPTSFNFNLSGAGCFQPPFSVDSVVCFTPTASCTVDFQLTFGASQRVELNVRDNGAGGSCDTTAGICVASTGVDAGSGSNATSPQTLSSVNLTGGVNYCFVASTSSVVQHTFNITGTGCGALPVQLTHISVD